MTASSVAQAATGLSVSGSSGIGSRRRGMGWSMGMLSVVTGFGMGILL